MENYSDPNLNIPHYFKVSQGSDFFIPREKGVFPFREKSPSKFPIPPPRTLWRRQHVAALEGGNQQRTYAICVTLQKSRLWSLIKVHLVKKNKWRFKRQTQFRLITIVIIPFPSSIVAYFEIDSPSKFQRRTFSVNFNSIISMYTYIFLKRAPRDLLFQIFSDCLKNHGPLSKQIRQ